MSLILEISRELQADEVKLIQSVASTMDTSIALSYENNKNSSRVVITYNQSISLSFINALKVLILGICKTYNHTSMLQAESFASIGNAPSLEGARKVDPLVADQTVKSQPLQESPCEQHEVSPIDNEEGEETPGQFERPMSLKGQRHVFLYKCRYGQLKSIIDHCGCWGLRMASLQEKWPCLVVYCAKNREEWMNAFRKIQKLERADFLRKRVSDSIRNVDMKKLEELTQTYGQKWERSCGVRCRNACISLCVQSPSSPENPSVSVCGLTSYVENLYRVFVEYHLAAEDDTAGVVHQPAAAPVRCGESGEGEVA